MPGEELISDRTDGFSDFTEAGYRRLLDIAARHYAFRPFGTDEAGPHMLLRHDVDFSPHRALTLARIEAEKGVRSTYFWLFHSDFYNLLEAEVAAIVRQIGALGHWTGLHFDLSFYADIADETSLSRRLSAERHMLADLSGQPVEAFSFHNPTTNSSLSFRGERIAGMVNAYGKALSDRYRYLSDSNGYWRFDSPFVVLAEGRHPAVHMLIHPEWWTPDPMSPRARVVRALQGRLDAAARRYDAFLSHWGRENVR